jgi:hypothetical protein
MDNLETQLTLTTIHRDEGKYTKKNNVIQETKMIRNTDTSTKYKTFLKYYIILILE